LAVLLTRPEDIRPDSGKALGAKAKAKAMDTTPRPRPGA